METAVVYRVVDKDKEFVYGVFDLKCEAQIYNTEIWDNEFEVEEYIIPMDMAKYIFKVGE